MTASQARAALPRILDSVTDGEEVTITRHGRPVAVVVRPDTLRVRRAEAALDAASAIHDVLQVGRKQPLGSRPALSEARAEELIKAARAGRSRG